MMTKAQLFALYSLKGLATMEAARKAGYEGTPGVDAYEMLDNAKKCLARDLERDVIEETLLHHREMCSVLGGMLKGLDVAERFKEEL